MKHLNTYVEEQFNTEWDYVVEMASIGYPVLNKTNHYIAVHGTNAGDRQRPHVHIYLSDDKRPFSKFNFEIALDEILCYDEINLIRMKDQSKHIDRKNRNICSWNGYNKLYEIKGYESEKDKEKRLQHPNVIVIDKNNISKYLDYVINKYGKNFIELYNK